VHRALLAAFCWVAWSESGVHGPGWPLAWTQVVMLSYRVLGYVHGEGSGVTVAILACHVALAVTLHGLKVPAR
jgi:hypothetical protein